MPVARFEMPDGRIARFEVPEGTTPEQANALIQQQISQSAALTTGLAAPNAAPMGAGSPAPQQTPQKPSEGRSLGKSIRAGLANTGIQAWLGAKQLFTDLSPEEQKVRKISNDEANEDTAGKITNFLGDVALTAIPGAGAGARAAKLATALPKAAQAASAVLASGAGQGLVSSALEATDNRSDRAGKFAKDAMMGAAVNGVVGLGAKGLTKAFTPTVDAQKVFDVGGNPTLYQGADSWIGKQVGGLTNNIFDNSKRQGKEALNATIEELAPGVRNAKYRDSLKELNDMVKIGYDQAIPSQRYVRTKDFESLRDALSPIMRSKDRPMTTKEIEAIFQGDTKGRYMSSWEVQKYRQDIQNAIDQATQAGKINPRSSGTDREVAETLIRARDIFDQKIRMKGATKDQLALLTTTDQQNILAKKLRELLNSASKQDDVSVRNVRDLYKGDSPHTALVSATGDSKLHRRVLDPFNDVMGDASSFEVPRAFRAAAGSALKGAGLTWAGVNSLGPLGLLPVSAAYGISMLGQTAKGSRFLFGQEQWQKKLADKIRLAGDKYNVKGANVLMNLDEEDNE